MKKQEFVRRVCRGVLSAMACVAMATGAARAEEIILPAGSDQCQSEPTDLVNNRPVGAVEVVKIPPAEATNPPPSVAAGEFTYVVFGDTQDYIEQSDKSYTNPSFVSRIDWILGQKDQRRIKFVTHLGDVVNNPASEEEWQIATSQFARLWDDFRVLLPCAFAPGNHDLTWGDTTPITDHLDSRDLSGGLGYGSFDGFEGRQYSKLSDINDRYSDREAQHAPEISDVAGCGANSCQRLETGDGKFIFIHLQCSIPTNVLKWVDSVLDENKDWPAIIVEHEGLGDVNAMLPFNSEADRLNMGRMRASRYTSNGSTSPQYQWERCFSRHPNVLMILSGGSNELLSGIRTSRGLYGNDVVEINQTYPVFSKSLHYSDWLRTYVINPDKQTITVHTYSPQQNRLCDGKGDEFDKSKSHLKEDYQFATNCPHHFTIDYGRLRAGVSTQQAGITFRTVTDDPLKDGSQVNGRELYQDGLGFSGLVTYPIVSRVDVKSVGEKISIKYFLVNDYEIGPKDGDKLRVLGVVRPRVVLTQGVKATEVTDALTGDVVAGGGGWYEVSVPLATAAERLHIAENDLTNVVATVATVPEGTRSAPWTVGKDVKAYLEEGMLFVEGTGAMTNFKFAADAPWAPAASCIDRVEVAPTVAPIGEHAFDGIPANVPLALTETQVPRAAGSILPPGAEAIAIQGGKVLLGVSVCTNGNVETTTEGWERAKVEAVDLDEESGTAILTVPATAEKGFMILKSKDADPSNRSGRPDTADVQHD